MSLILVLYENWSPKILGSKNVHSLERKFRVRRLRTAAVRKGGEILGKLKQLV